MDTVIETLFLRRPKLHYVSPPVCDFIFSSSSGPVIILNDISRLGAITGLVLGGQGGFMLTWNVYPGALCYSVYRSDTQDGVYVIVAECIDNPEIDLSPFGAGFYRVSAITPDGETDLSPPVHFPGGGGMTCPQFTGTAPNVDGQEGTSLTLGPVPVDEGGGGGTVTYEWFKDGVFYLDTTDTTKNSLTIVDPVVDDTGVYTLHIGNDHEECAKVSNDITLTVVPPDPQAYWDFDEVTGDRVDSVQSIHLVPDSAQVTFGPGKVDNAVNFLDTTGLQQYNFLFAASTPKLKYGGQGITAWGWFNLKSFTGHPGVQIFGFSWADGHFTFTWAPWVPNSLLLEFADDSVFTSLDIIPPDPTLNAWHFYVAWYDPADQKLHLQIDNGTVLDSASTMAPPPGFEDTALNIIVGNLSVGVKFDMLMDEFGIYQGVLSAGARNFLWNNGNGVTWPF